MKFVIRPEMADVFRDAAGHLPDNFEVWDGSTRAASGEPETWLDFPLGSPEGRLLFRLGRQDLYDQARGLATQGVPPHRTFKGKVTAQWKRDCGRRR